MAKKSFRNSPAMQFITSEPVEEKRKEPAVKPPVVKAQPEVKKPKPSSAPTAKKPASASSSKAGEGSAFAISGQPVPMKPNPAYVETRSKRVQLLMQPSLHKGLLEVAQKKDVSFNEAVHEILSEYLKNNESFKG